MLKKELIEKLCPMDAFLTSHPIKIDMPYRDKNHPENFFQIDIYRKGAPFLVHKDLADVTLLFSKMLYDETGWITILRDGLRTIEAQTKMVNAPICQKNPHWFEPPVLISSPGGGGHPRGAAIDVTFADEKGAEIDMGTEFDYFSENPESNPAGRDYQDLPINVINARKKTETLFLKAADSLNFPLYPLPAEWWDYRYKSDVIKDWPALSDLDLPKEWRLCDI